MSFLDYVHKKIHGRRFKSYPNWTTRKPLKSISYNTNEQREWKSSISSFSFPSAMMLYKTISNDNKLLNLVNYLYKKYGQDNIIYGIKNKDGILRWEFYYYQCEGSSLHNFDNIIDDCLENNIKITKEKINYNNLFIISFDYKNEKEYSPDIDLYYKRIVCKKSIVRAFSEVFNLANNKVRGEYVIDTYENIKKNVSSYLGLIGIHDNSVRNWVINEVDRYIMNKKKTNDINIIIINKYDQIGIGWLGINYHEFLCFLEENSWSDKLVSFWKKNKKSFVHLPNEIIIHYDLTGKPVRSAYYGSI